MVPKVLVLRAAGSNCDQETKFAFDYVGGRADLVHINRLLTGEIDLDAYHILAIPGGFTYGDDISAGKILANQLKYKLKEDLIKFHRDGKLIIGICNGFQVLVRAGLLPDMNFEQRVTLSNNDSGKFEDRWVTLKINKTPCVFTQGLEKALYLPVAHAEGKFIPQDEGIVDELSASDQIVFQYSSPTGGEVKYPQNPNGSYLDIAGICDPSGRVLGMMPHPERHIHPTNNPLWTRNGLSDNGDGTLLFRNAIEFF